MRAIEINLNISRLIDIRYGESQFKRIDEFWFDFKPDGSKERTSAFAPNLFRDTEHNRAIIQKIADTYTDLKKITDSYEKNVSQLRNQIEK